MTRKEILRLMPRDSKDLDGAQRIIALGHPVIGPALDDIVHCMRVADSIVADAFADFVGTVGAAAAPAIAKELLPNENLWIRDRVLLKILPKWSTEDVMQLRDTLMTIASLQPDPYDNDIRCIQILTDRRLVDTSWLQDLIESKTRWWQRRCLLITKAKEGILRAEQFVDDNPT